MQDKNPILSNYTQLWWYLPLMKMSANRNDRVVDHSTRCEGQWKAIRAVTSLTGEHPVLVNPIPQPRT
jgi:hypothetical protein